MRTSVALAVACGLLGGCAIAPYDDEATAARYGELRGDQRVHRDPIPYRDDGVYHRGPYDRNPDVGHDDQWR